MNKEEREEGYYWVRWNLPGLGWSIAFWTPQKNGWYTINCDECFATSNFEFISPVMIPNPYE